MPLTFRSQAFAKQLRPSSQEYALNNGARQALRIIGIRAFMHQTFRDHAFGKQFRPSLQENLLMTPTRNCASSAAFHAPNFPKSCVPPQFSKVHTGGANPRMRIISISRIRVSMCQTFRSHAFGKQFRPSSLGPADGAHPRPGIINISRIKRLCPKRSAVLHLESNSVTVYKSMC